MHLLEKSLMDQNDIVVVQHRELQMEPLSRILNQQEGRALTAANKEAIERAAMQIYTNARSLALMEPPDDQQDIETSDQPKKIITEADLARVSNHLIDQLSILLSFVNHLQLGLEFETYCTDIQKKE